MDGDKDGWVGEWYNYNRVIMYCSLYAMHINAYQPHPFYADHLIWSLLDLGAWAKGPHNTICTFEPQHTVKFHKVKFQKLYCLLYLSLCYWANQSDQ